MEESESALSMASVSAHLAWRAHQQWSSAATRLVTAPDYSPGISLVLLHDRTVGTLSTELAIELGLKSNARDIRISASTQRHILDRRDIQREDDVSHCLDRLTEALSNIRFVLTPQPEPTVWALIGLVPTTSRHIVMPLKLVRAEAAGWQVDELWLRTAHPMGAKTLRRHRARGELRPITAV